MAINAFGYYAELHALLCHTRNLTHRHSHTHTQKDPTFPLKGCVALVTICSQSIVDFLQYIRKLTYRIADKLKKRDFTKKNALKEYLDI